ncbi:MAG: ParA family protein [Lentisphaerae bacterium]|nr:ParA family protein [Lentisphaerota bacterium]
MNILAIWNQKGGVGKTTLTLQLAGYFSIEEKKSILVIDLDPQPSCYEIFKMGKLGFDVVTKMPKEKPTQDIILIDHPPGTQELPQTTRVLVPFQPSILSYKAAQRSFAFLERSKKKVIKVLSGVDLRKREHQAVKQQLNKNTQNNIITISNRSIYERSLGQGLTVFHSEIKGLYGISQAKNEIGFLANQIFK